LYLFNLFTLALKSDSMLKFLLILFGFLPFITISGQQITNIKVKQAGDNVVITYDISGDKVGQTFDIIVDCSFDGGKTFSIIPRTLTGDRKGINAGTEKKIVWDVLCEREVLTGDQFVFQVVPIINNLEVAKLVAANTFTDPRDGHVYKWVKIGKQIWMAENLSYLPIISASKQNSITESCCYVYNYCGKDISEAKANLNYKTYGVLYNWISANRDCPKGWHLPTKKEWKISINSLGSEDVARGKLKETGTSHWSSPNTGAIYSTGFIALPGGHYYNGEFDFMSIRVGFWISSAYCATCEVVRFILLRKCA